MRLLFSTRSNTKIAVVGNYFITPYYPPFQPPNANALAFDKILGNAAAAFGLPFTDPIANNWLNSNNFTIYMGNDNVHPTIAGYTIIASNLVATLPSSFSALPVTLSYYNSFANSKIISTNVVVASATFSASPVSGSAPLPVNFTYTGTNGSTFAWSFGDGGISAASSPAHTYNSAGTYTVSLAVNGSVSNAITSMITVTNPAPAPASAMFSATAT